MLKRTIYSLVLFPVVVYVVVVGGMPLRITLLAVSAIALWELYKAVYTKLSAINYLGFLPIFLLHFFMSNEYFFVFVLVWIMVNFIYLVFAYEVTNGKANPLYYIANMVLPFYTGAFFATIYLSRNISPYFVWLIFIGAWGYDTCAYFFGKFFGKRKLTPILSPNKTIEGAIGGVVGASVIGVAYSLVVSGIFGLYDINILLYGIICGVLAIFAQFGDLAASTIKRYTGIKDFGRIIPGHGGVMDRFDSVMFTGPTFYIILAYII
ncbi:MAG: phosphatidate cytidylyltransferase [Defluviitaleaceae bacterium]|nr:phosphatidate cytidylyltransferase [Defluviitaleaceae bacterium]